MTGPSSFFGASSGYPSKNQFFVGFEFSTASDQFLSILILKRSKNYLGEDQIRGGHLNIHDEIIFSKCKNWPKMAIFAYFWAFFQNWGFQVEIVVTLTHFYWFSFKLDESIDKACRFSTSVSNLSWLQKIPVKLLGFSVKMGFPIFDMLLS